MIRRLDSLKFGNLFTVVNADPKELWCYYTDDNGNCVCALLAHCYDGKHWNLDVEETISTWFKPETLVERVSYTLTVEKLPD